MARARAGSGYSDPRHCERRESGGHPGKRGGHYLTGTPRRPDEAVRSGASEGEDWTRAVRPEVEVKKVGRYQRAKRPGYSAAATKAVRRKRKRSAIVSPTAWRDGAESGLQKAIVTGRLKDRNKMERRLGKIQARHPQVNDLYDLLRCGIRLKACVCSGRSKRKS